MEGFLSIGSLTIATDQIAAFGSVPASPVCGEFFVPEHVFFILKTGDRLTHNTARADDVAEEIRDILRPRREQASGVNG